MITDIPILDTALFLTKFARENIPDLKISNKGLYGYFWWVLHYDTNLIIYKGKDIIGYIDWWKFENKEDVNIDTPPKDPTKGKFAVVPYLIVKPEYRKSGLVAKLTEFAKKINPDVEWVSYRKRKVNKIKELKIDG